MLSSVTESVIWRTSSFDVLGVFSPAIPSNIMAVGLKIVRIMSVVAG